MNVLNAESMVHYYQTFERVAKGFTVGEQNYTIYTDTLLCKP